MTSITIIDIITVSGTIAMAIFTLIGFILAIWQYKSESTRRKRSETLSLYTNLFKKTINLRDKYRKKSATGNLFDSETLHTNPVLCNQVLNLLTHFESFAKGLQYGIYDFEIFIYLTPKEMLEILEALSKFVVNERTAKNYNLLFNEFSDLYRRTEICMEKKIRHEKVPKKYKRVKV